MRAEDIANEIFEAFHPQFTVAKTPDLPHLLSAPDFVIGGDGRLFGIFCLKVEEMRQPGLLLFRLAISRLGLPDMVCALVIESAQTSRVQLEFLEDNFDLVIQPNLISQLGIGIFDPYDPLRVRYDTREATMDRYSQALAAGRLGARSTRIAAHPYTLLSQLRDRGGIAILSESRRYSLFGPNVETVKVRDNVSVMAHTFEGRQGDLRSLRRFGYEALATNYTLDNGLPYLTHPEMFILLVDRPPTNRLDPTKPRRASAFAGVVVVEAASLDHVERTSDRLENFVRTKRN